MATPPPQSNSDSHGLIRGMGLGSATALNMIDMIGVGPFITMPLVLSAMGGPQAMLGWIAGALFAVCDGWFCGIGRGDAGSGGPYRYLREIYGPHKWGRLISFLFIWQLSFSAPLRLRRAASGWPAMPPITGPAWRRFMPQHTASLYLPWAGPLQVSWIVTPGTAISSRYLLFHRCAAVSAHHRHRAALNSTVVRRDGDYRVDHLRRLDAFQFRPRI